MTTNLNATARPYPSQYVLPWTLKGGIEVTIAHCPREIGSHLL